MKGIYTFHAFIMNLSNRIRGKVLRIQIIQKFRKINLIKKNAALLLCKNRIVVKAIKKMIFLYSLKKIIVKELEPNSVLNPLTSSLSPSEKS